MRYGFILIPLFLFAPLTATCQQDMQTARPAGAEIAAPILIPPSLKVSTQKHCDELDGFVRLSATIDAAGLPGELKTLEASDRRLVGFATKFIAAQRFKPGVIDGSVAPVPVELTIGLHTCAQREKLPTDGDFYNITLRAHPLIALNVVTPPATQVIALPVRAEASVGEQVGGHISAPIVTVLIDPQIPVSRKFQKRGLCLLGVTIDANGIPQNIHVFRSLDPELDNNAIEAVKNWRFKPALRDGSTPVAVEGTVSAMFENVEKEPVAFATFIPETPEEVQASIANHATKQPGLEAVNLDEVTALYMPQSRVTGRCLVSMVIDIDGVPQNVHVIKGLDSSLDLDTVAMIEHLRFKPVMKNGTTPVPVGLIIPVRYSQKPEWKDIFNDGLTLAIFLLL
jgi:TonB family protein